MKSTRKELYMGITLLIGFCVVLVGLFSPIINGQNPINYFDNLYNSISKGSVYYIPEMMSENEQIENKPIIASIGFLTNSQADSMLQVYQEAGIKAEKQQESIQISTSLSTLLGIMLRDSDAMFKNDGQQLKATYGMDEKEVLYVWWLTLKDVKKELNSANRFEEAKFANAVHTKAVECAFNYYEIEPYNIMDEAWFVIASLVFYVIYTLWFGYSIMYIFTGLGLKLEH